MALCYCPISALQASSPRAEPSNRDFPNLQDWLTMKMRLFLSLTALALAATFVGGVTVARADGITSEQAQQILDELKAIRKTLEARPVAPAQPSPQAPAPVDDKVSMAFPAGGFSVGKENAPLVLVEYTDYQCPFCQRYHNDSFAQIKTN